MGKVVLIFSCCFNDFLTFTNSQLENFLTEITDWEMENGYSLLEGGMIYNDGHLKVPEDGVYYVYAQLYFHSGRVLVIKNYEEYLTMLDYSDVSDGSKYAGGAFRLKAGDTISLQVAMAVKLYMAPYHSYFGGFLIRWASYHRVKALKEIVSRYQ